MNYCKSSKYNGYILYLLDFSISIMDIKTSDYSMKVGTFSIRIIIYCLDTYLFLFILRDEYLNPVIEVLQ